MSSIFIHSLLKKFYWSGQNRGKFLPRRIELQPRGSSRSLYKINPTWRTSVWNSYSKPSFQLIKALKNGPSAYECAAVLKNCRCYHYCGNPYSNRLEFAQVRMLFLPDARITIGIPTVMISTGNFGALSSTRTPMDRSSRVLWVRSSAWNMNSTQTSSKSG